MRIKYNRIYKEYLASSIVDKEQRVFVRKQLAELKTRPEFWDYLHKQWKRSQRKKCFYCGTKINNPRRAWKKEIEYNFHIEHRIPVYRGGTNAPNNLVLACKPCNIEKGTELMERKHVRGKLRRNKNKIYF